MVNRSDVAKAAGVSPAVVSYVLNGGPRGVAPATRDLVLRAVEELGYRPNRIAASLRRKRTNSMGLIVPDNTNPFFAELAREIEEVAFAHGYTLLLGNAMDEEDREAAYVREFLDWHVDGIFLIPSGSSISVLPEIRSSNTPFVVLDRELADSSVSDFQVRSDNVTGGQMAVRHLAGHGRKRIACIAGPRSMHNAGERTLGWRTALQDLDEVQAGPLVEVPISRFDGRHAAHRIMRDDPATDAIFVTSDEQAIGVLRALREIGLDCPADVAVVSFDGTSHSAVTTPGLTTVRQPIPDMARRAFELLLAQGESAGPVDDHVLLPVQLIARGSCGCADEFDVDADAVTPRAERKAK